MSGLAARFAANGLQCSLLALIAFLPIGGLALLSPDQVQLDGGDEYTLAAILVSRFLTPPVAVLMTAYLARKDRYLENSLWKVFRASGLPSVGLVLGVLVFGLFSALFLVVPGVAFFLASAVVVPVLVVEGLKGPAAIKRSWELTKDHRWPLLGFWTLYGAFSGLVLALVSLSTKHSGSVVIEPLPLVQQDLFLPVILALCVLYAGVVTASYEIYAHLVPAESDAKPE